MRNWGLDNSANFVHARNRTNTGGVKLGEGKHTDLVDGHGRGNNGRGDEGRFDDLPPVDVVIPDDAAELADEARAVHRELRSQRRRAFLTRVFRTRRWRRFGLSGPLIIAVLLAVALVASTLGVLRPRQDGQPPPALPLAVANDRTPGEPGGLVPAGTLVVDGSTQPSHGLRPAVLAFPPAGCDCDEELDGVFRQVREFGLTMYLVGDSATAGEIIDAANGIGNGTAVPVVDGGGVLTAVYEDTGLVVVLIHADGVVRTVVRDLPADAVLEPDLAGLAGPGAR